MSFLINLGQKAWLTLNELVDTKNMPTEVTTEEEFRRLPFKTKLVALWWFLKVTFCVLVMVVVCLNIKSRWGKVTNV